MANNLIDTELPGVALGGALGFALAVYLVAAAARRRFDAAAAVIASIWVVGCLYYEKLVGPLGDLGVGYAPLVGMWLAALVALTVLVARLRRPPLVAHALLNGMALVLFAFPVWQTLAFEWRNGAARDVYDGDRAAAELPQMAARAAGTDRPPDIYHFVFDRLASDEVLARHFGVEPGIGRFLGERGFYVAEASHSNYPMTGHSLGSMFYMDYLGLLADPRVAGDNWQPVYEMVSDHRVARFLRARGYDLVQFGGWWRGTYDNPLADENHPLGFSEFNMNYLQGTALRPLFRALPATGVTMRLDWDRGQCQRVARQAEMIAGIGARERPTYVFAHFLVPHEPYVFAPDGRCLSRAESVARGRARGYVEQVAYAHRLIEQLVTALQAEGRPRPIIIIQADEGPYPERGAFHDGGIPWQDAPAEQLRIKTGILNAYYFPDGDYAGLRPDSTPINTYRVLFNHFLGADFPLLPDRIYAFPSVTDHFEFHDVTAIVQGEETGVHRSVAGMRAAPGQQRRAR
jgi:hypothetical protein